MLERASQAPTGRPEPDEYGPHAAEDIAFVQSDDAVAALRGEIQATLDLLGGLDESSVAGLTYGPGKWTLKEVVGHMADDERIFAYRALCISRGDERPLAGFEQDEYMAKSEFESRTLEDLLAELVAVRAATVALLMGLTDKQWLKRGTVEDYGVSVRGLAFHIAAHERHHRDVLKDSYLRGI